MKNVIRSQSSIKEIKSRITELIKRNRECHIFLGNRAENQEHFVVFVIPSSGIILSILLNTI